MLRYRCAIIGFDEIDDDITGAVNIIVIGGTSEEYSAGLMAVVAAQDRDGTT